MVEIYTSEIHGPMSSCQWHYYFNLLPENERERNTKYLRWEDKHAHLFGKLLLREALFKYGFNSNILDNLRFNDYQKPFIDDNINFNISHSGKYVICVISKEVELGVDLEQKTLQINPDEFKWIFSQAEWEYLSRVEEKLGLFYRLWTRKESVIKANGRGLSIPLNKVDVLSESVVIEGQTWFISDLHFDTNYSSSLATSCKDCTMSFNQVDFYI